MRGSEPDEVAAEFLGRVKFTNGEIGHHGRLSGQGTNHRWQWAGLLEGLGARPGSEREFRLAIMVDRPAKKILGLDFGGDGIKRGSYHGRWDEDIDFARARSVVDGSEKTVAQDFEGFDGVL